MVSAAPLDQLKAGAHGQHRPENETDQIITIPSNHEETHFTTPFEVSHTRLKCTRKIVLKSGKVSRDHLWLMTCWIVERQLRRSSL